MAVSFRSLRRPLRRLLVNAAGATLAVAGAAALLHTSQPTDAGEPTAPTVHAQLRTPSDARVQALMRRFECRTHGFDDHQVTRSAIIRRANGRIAVVGFDRGWRVFRRHGAGSLVAVCLRPPH